LNIYVSLFNCSFIEPDTLDSFYDILYLLSVGAGVGYRITWDVADKLPRFRNDVKLQVVPYNPLPKTMRKDKTQVLKLDGTISIVVGDSRDGWGKAVTEFLKYMSYEIEHDYKNIRMVFNNIRPGGEPLRTFGGYSSGAEPFIQAIKKMHEVVTGDYLDSHGNILTKAPIDGKLRPIHMMHIANSIAEAIVVGGVRRSAMIALFSRTDDEMAKAKTSFVDFSDRKISHYWISNNTMVIEEGYEPTKKEVTTWMENIKTFGEPGFMNEIEVKKRHPKARGMNPCGEILLRSKQTCNLVTFNVISYLNEDKTINYDLLEQDLRVLTRSAYRVTMNKLELEDWDKTQEEDRLLGVSPSSWMDFIEATNMNIEEENNFMDWLYNIIRKAADEYADELGLSHSLNVTAVKPSGTLSLVANSSSAGVHMGHSPFYYRTIRIDKTNPMFKVISKLNWRIEDDITRPDTTAVIYFPVKSEVKRTKFDVSVIEQLDRYKRFQEHYTDQNTSITVSVQNHEWEDATNWLYENWKYFTAVSFLPLTDHQYAQAPYQTITKEEYEAVSVGLDDLSHELLTKYLELNEYYKEEEIADDPDCATGSCAADRL
jgi:adenosylcobalamin-dependent ribonucleoside-triphosphate reductase